MEVAYYGFMDEEGDLECSEESQRRLARLGKAMSRLAGEEKKKMLKKRKK